jgi:hypothetical protein
MVNALAEGFGGRKKEPHQFYLAGFIKPAMTYFPVVTVSSARRA